MKNKNVLPCVVTVTNDETEVFMEMAIWEMIMSVILKTDFILKK